MSSFMYRLETWTSFAACSWIALVTRGLQCPRLQTEMPAAKSRNSTPSSSKSFAPSPRTKSCFGA